MSDAEEQQDFFSSQPGPSSKEPRPALFFDDDEEEEEEEDEVLMVEEKVDEKSKASLTANGKRDNGIQQPSKPNKRLRRGSGEAGDGGSRQASVISDSPPLAEWDKRFIGTFIIEAWSLSKGSNYVQQGDKVRISRQKPKVASQQGASTSSKGGSMIGKKQTKLSFGPAPTSSSKKAKVKEDYVVRFSNMRGELVGDRSGSSIMTIH
jgi:DNA repair protein RAD5